MISALLLTLASVAIVLFWHRVGMRMIERSVFVAPLPLEKQRRATDVLPAAQVLVGASSCSEGVTYSAETRSERVERKRAA